MNPNKFGIEFDHWSKSFGKKWWTIRTRSLIKWIFSVTLNFFFTHRRCGIDENTILTHFYKKYSETLVKVPQCYRSGYCGPLIRIIFRKKNPETRTWKYFNLTLNKHETFKSYRRDSDVIRRFADGSTNLVLKPGFF